MVRVRESALWPIKKPLVGSAERRELELLLGRKQRAGETTMGTTVSLRISDRLDGELGRAIVAVDGLRGGLSILREGKATLEPLKSLD